MAPEGWNVEDGKKYKVEVTQKVEDNMNEEVDSNHVNDVKEEDEEVYHMKVNACSQQERENDKEKNEVPQGSVVHYNGRNQEQQAKYKVEHQKDRQQQVQKDYLNQKP